MVAIAEKIGEAWRQKSPFGPIEINLNNLLHALSEKWPGVFPQKLGIFADVYCYMILRTVQIEDAPHIADLCTELGYALDVATAQNRISQLLSDPNHVAFVVEIEGQIQGFIHAFRTIRLTTDPFVEICGLDVSEKYRRKGLGKHLIEAVEQWTALEKSLRVRCNVKRAEAHAFYQAMHFYELKTQKVFGKKLR